MDYFYGASQSKIDDLIICEMTCERFDLLGHQFTIKLSGPAKRAWIPKAITPVTHYLSNPEEMTPAPSWYQQEKKGCRGFSK